jgi:catechol 2,3-dioxygenase-like lactoylglutathione lyase family enzyme
MISLLLLASMQIGASGMDHVGIGVRDLKAATASFTKLGFVVSPGGQHPGGTENNMIFFPDGSYLELLGVYDAGKAAAIAATINKREGALFAGLAVKSAAGLATALKGRSLEVVGPTGGTIKLPTDTGTPPDRWWIVSFKNQAWPWSSIFYVEYEPVFLAQAKAGFQAQGAYAHPGSASRLHAVWFAAASTDSIAKVLEQTGLTVEPPVGADKLGAHASIARLERGAIVVLQPKATNGPAAEFVRSGNGVMGVTIAVRSVDSVLRSLKAGEHLQPYRGLFGRSVLIGPKEAHGAWVEFAEIP